MLTKGSLNCGFGVCNLLNAKIATVPRPCSPISLWFEGMHATCNHVQLWFLRDSRYAHPYSLRFVGMHATCNHYKQLNDYAFLCSSNSSLCFSNSSSISLSFFFNRWFSSSNSRILCCLIDDKHDHLFPKMLLQSINFGTTAKSRYYLFKISADVFCRNFFRNFLSNALHLNIS